MTGKHTLLEELDAIDKSLLEGTATPEQEARGQQLVTLADSAPELLETCKRLAEDCRMALNGEWDKSDDGFEAGLQLLEDVIARATSGALPSSGKVITVTVQWGSVQDVAGIPPGYELRVEDFDEGDDAHPSWDAEKGCFVRVYGES